jgi:hypothetical protein
MPPLTLMSHYAIDYSIRHIDAIDYYAIIDYFHAGQPSRRCISPLPLIAITIRHAFTIIDATMPPLTPLLASFQVDTPRHIIFAR